MKKFLMILALVMAVSASCFAAGASGRFAAEEKAADAFIAALTGDSVTYENVQKSFSKGLKEKITAQNFTTTKEDIKKQIGIIKNINFISLSKPYNLQNGYNGIDELLYVGTVGPNKFVRIVMLFGLENSVPKLTGFQFSQPIEVKQPEAPAKK